MVLRRCRRLLGDEDEAVDAMQDVFVQLIRYRDRLDESAPSSLLYRMATNVCLNRIRSRGRRRESGDEQLLWRIATSEGHENRAGARSLLRRVFRREQESTLAMAVMHLLDGMTLEEVARESGMSVSGVRKRLRGLKDRVEALEGVER
jgi:RNA polymerase sigma-70 factor (ECF subfamily)